MNKPQPTAATTRKADRHVVAKLPEPNFSQLGEEPATSECFLEAMAPHFKRLVSIHNESCDFSVGSPEYLRLRQRLIDEARFVVGDLVFESYQPGHVSDDMELLIGGDSLESRVVWTSYWVVDSIDQFAFDCRDTPDALNCYCQTLFDWWLLVRELGAAAMANGGAPTCWH